MTTVLCLKLLTLLMATMTINVNLSPQLDEMVRQKVASGLYTSASEAKQMGSSLAKLHYFTKTLNFLLVAWFC